MSLPTLAHKLTLRAHIQANATVLTFDAGNSAISAKFAGAVTQSDAIKIAEWYNALTDPPLYAWHFSRTRMQMRTAILLSQSGAQQIDSLTASKREVLLWLLDDTINPNLSSVRAVLDDVTGSQNSLKSAVLDGCKRHLTNVQRVFCTGTGSFAAPFDNATDGGFEGSLDAGGNDILDIKGLPV